MFRATHRHSQQPDWSVLMRRACGLGAVSLLVVAAALAAYNAPTAGFRFAILGDRTGQAQPGVYEEAWREVAADQPDFVITVGDTIEGGSDLTAEKEWQDVSLMLAPYRKY